MNRLVTLRRNSIPALKRKGLVAISVKAHSPRHAFELARKMHWSEEEQFAAEALASIFFEFGEIEFIQIISDFSPALTRELCLESHHRNQKKKCHFPIQACVCSCHVCFICEVRDVVKGNCGCECHGKSCSFCSGWHRNRRRDRNNRLDRKRRYWRKKSNWSDESDYYDECDEEDSFQEQCHPSVVTTDPPVEPNRPLSAKERLERVVERISKASGNTYPIETKYKVEGSVRQAKALKNGSILISEALVEELSEEELSFIVAHEYAHHDLSHRAKTEEVMKRDKEIATAAILALDLDLKSKGAGFGKRMLAAGTAAALEAAAFKAHVSSVSRENETEADCRAVELMRQAGYTPDAAVSAYKKLHGGRVPQHSLVNVVANVANGTHPLPKDRVRNLEKLTKLPTSDPRD